MATGKRPESYLLSSTAVARVPSVKWSPSHFRLFVGNLGPEATEDVLLAAFSQYKTLSKVSVPVDRKTAANKGFGFVSFGSSDDYLRAFKEMNGKYVGQRPVQLKRAESKKK